MSTASESPREQPALKRLGRYELIARIGVGGMAEVYLARQRGPMNFEKVVVVKSIHPHLSSDKDHVDMLLDEARIAARLKHPNVVDVYDLGVSDGQYFIAMEYLNGHPLLDVMRASQQRRRLPISGTVKILADVAAGLHAAHELEDHQGRPLDLVHRDVSPGNIIVLYTGQVKIVDFGIAKARGRVTETGLHRVKGKLGYLSPEQVSDAPVDRRSDIFALGVVLWEALTLRRLFRASGLAATVQAVLNHPIKPPSAYRADVPLALDAICMRALSRRPGQRFATAWEMQQELEAVLADIGDRGEQQMIAAYMQEMFGEQAASRQELVRQVMTATGEIQVTPEDRDTGEDFDVSAEVPGPGADDTPVSAAPPARVWKRWTIGGAAALALATALALALPGGGSESTASIHAAMARGPEAGADDSAGGEAVSASAKPVISAGSPERADEAGLAGDGGSRSSRAPRAPARELAPGDAAPGDDGSSSTAMTAVGASATRDRGRNNRRARAASGPRLHAASDSRVAPDAPGDASRARARASTLYREGVQQFVQGDSREAMRSFRAALEINPRYADAHRGMGMVLQQQGRSAQAVRAFRAYLRLAPRAADRDAIKRRIAALGG